MRTGYYQMGHAFFRLYLPEEIMTPPNLSKFQIQNSQRPEEGYIDYTLEVVEDFNKIQDYVEQHRIGPEITRKDLRVWNTASGECRIFYIEGNPVPYGISLQQQEKNYHVWISQEIQELLCCDTIFFSMFSLEKHMIHQDAMILHCAYMEHPKGAILFSAASGVGKSTQASLWKTYRGNRTMNGDRSLLTMEHGTWYANGWPVCGSSKICHNEALPIQAIVMLKQAKENKISRMTGLEALRLVMEQITINGWNGEFQMRVMDLLEDLLNKVPIYQLECDISEEAVRCLEEVLERGER